LLASQLFFLPTESAFDIAADARGRLGSDQLPNAPFTARSFFCALFTSFEQLLESRQSRNSRNDLFV
jgi:hypothetical protein